ncbi:helix-turn-helix domain-containing protein [Sulfurisphaera ohwakuensis]|uniref:Helix-turn-helix domain-containing protein n=1 Tax=Sulfurisphaera ohwakuensis TaxID=69656 RepID=A0A650CLW4_SULOH|nr:helix-turn-helix transcriptional regulator [Sulfurisphaera ohwakuensis]MBB5252424.1 transcriptional regulator with XRE-family HTH domain [Sulfurisphaera ohwakuensis]QGR18457.1 helix-turn-helix domain-containing protein [Sulfurisphaera ohwakuensis]
MRIVHNLSKDARERIISLLLEKRSKKELAEELGISPSAITKFLNGLTHPSDETIERAIEIADEEEKERIYEIIIEDIVESLEEFIKNNYFNSEKIKNIIIRSF